jgi:hypothetical protein
LFTVPIVKKFWILKIWSKNFILKC